MAPETAVRTDRVVVAPPTFRQDLRFLERVEQLAVQKLRPHLLGDPELPTGIEHCQAFASVELNRPQMLKTSSGVYPFLGMTVTSLVAAQSNIHPGPDWPGQVIQWLSGNWGPLYARPSKGLNWQSRVSG